MSSLRPHSQASSLAAQHFVPTPAVRRRPGARVDAMLPAYAAVSEAGVVRSHNEDRWQAVAQAGLFVVADGMGGYNAGEIAAELAVQTACQLIPQMAIDGSIEDAIDNAMHRAHDTCNVQIREYVVGNPDCLGMGTTIVSCLIRDGRLHVAHIGDSRAYLLRGGLLTRMTKDHSVGQEIADSGVLTEAQVRRLPGRGILTRALGVEKSVESACRVHDWQSTDTLLLCTDGLTDLVSDERIEQLLIEAAAAGPPAQARALVAAALQAGGSDNVTVLVVSGAGYRVPPAEGRAGKRAEASLEHPSGEQEQARQSRDDALRNQGMN